MAKTIFFSYCHACAENRDRVQKLARAWDGDDLVVLYDSKASTSPTGPARGGWNLWMDESIAASDYVLVFCDVPYHERFYLKTPPRDGRGVKWEGAIIRQELYDLGMINEKFIPVLFDVRNDKLVPTPLRAYSNYVIPGEAEKLRVLLSPRRIFPAAPSYRKISRSYSKVFHATPKLKKPVTKAVSAPKKGKRPKKP